MKVVKNVYRLVKMRDGARTWYECELCGALHAEEARKHGLEHVALEKPQPTD